MPEFTVTGISYATRFFGKYTAETPEEAISMAEDEHGTDYPSMCIGCSEVILPDPVFKMSAEDANGDVKAERNV